MPSLEQTLLAHDFVLLRAIAAQAGLALQAPNPRAAAAELAQALKEPEPLELLLDRALDERARRALALLAGGGGRLLAAAFIRRCGGVRPLGPAALTREQPWLKPATPAEALYFNGLAGRAFMDSEGGPQEYFYIPSDLLPLLPALPDPGQSVSAASAVAPVEVAGVEESAGPAALVDDLTSLLAAVQLHPGRPPGTADLAGHLNLPIVDFGLALGAGLGLIQPDGRLDPEAVKPFLSAGRGAQLQALARAWRESTTWNDLMHVPGLRPEPGAWRNDPPAAREFLIKLLAGLPAGEWRSLESLVAFVRERQPDFQRLNGDYDSWYIRDADSGEYLRGFASWDKVDGALIRFLLDGPLNWLGLVERRLAPPAIRLTPLFAAFVSGAPFDIPETPARLFVSRTGGLSAAPAVNRFERFQAARIGEWLPRGAGGSYEYRLTGNSLQAAAAQGIMARHILAFLRRAADPLPEHVAALIERWGRRGIEARALQATVLKLSGPDVLEQLMRSPRTRRWLGEALGDRAVEVKDWEKLREAMVELGLAVEWLPRR
jgi:hypothetical protein